MRELHLENWLNPIGLWPSVGNCLDPLPRQQGSHPTVGRTIAQTNGLGLYKKASQEEARPHHSLHGFWSSSCLSFCPDFCQPWNVTWKYKPNKHFPPQLLLIRKLDHSNRSTRRCLLQRNSQLHRNSVWESLWKPGNIIVQY